MKTYRIDVQRHCAACQRRFIQWCLNLTSDAKMVQGFPMPLCRTTKQKLAPKTASLVCNTECQQKLACHPSYSGIPFSERGRVRTCSTWRLLLRPWPISAIVNNWITNHQITAGAKTKAKNSQTNFQTNKSVGSKHRLCLQNHILLLSFKIV